MYDLIKLLCFLCFFTFLLSCNDNEKKVEGTAKKNKAEYEVEKINVTQDQSKQILNAYLLIKQALVESDAAEAAKAAEPLVNLTENSDNEFLKSIHESVSKLVKSTEIEVQRDAFIHFQIVFMQ